MSRTVRTTALDGAMSLLGLILPAGFNYFPTELY